MFDEKFNTILNLLLDLDEEFNADFNKFYKKLPQSVLDKCAKCKRFEKETEDGCYSLEFYSRDGHKNNELEFDVSFFSDNDDEAEDWYLLNISKVCPEDLEELPQKEPDKEYDVELVDEVGSFSLDTEKIKDGKNISFEYNFELYLAPDGVHLKMIKAVAQDLDSTNLEEVKIVDTKIDKSLLLGTGTQSGSQPIN